MTRNEVYEMESLLHEIEYHGFIVIPLQKLYRLLDKGNKAAGTWKALLDVWENIGRKRDDLHLTDLPGGLILLTEVEPERAKTRAGEKRLRPRLNETA
jgi:hypothetical protein